MLNKKICYQSEQYSVEVQVPSLFQENTVSSVGIANGVDRYVTESMPTGKLIAEARPKQKPTETLTSMSIPVLERIWIDIETQRSTNQKCFEDSKATLDQSDMINQSLGKLTEQF